MLARPGRVGIEGLAKSVDVILGWGKISPKPAVGLRQRVDPDRTRRMAIERVEERRNRDRVAQLSACREDALAQVCLLKEAGINPTSCEGPRDSGEQMDSERSCAGRTPPTTCAATHLNPDAANAAPRREVTYRVWAGKSRATPSAATYEGSGRGVLGRCAGNRKEVGRHRRTHPTVSADAPRLRRRQLAADARRWARRWHRARVSGTLPAALSLRARLHPSSLPGRRRRP